MASYSCFVFIRIVETSEKSEQAFRNTFARAHGGLSIAQISTLPDIPIFYLVHRKIVVSHVETFSVGFKIRITCDRIQVMSTFKFTDIGKITFRSQILDLAESQIGAAITTFFQFVAVISRPIRMIFPLAVFISDNLIIR